MRYFLAALLLPLLLCGCSVSPSIEAQPAEETGSHTVNETIAADSTTAGVTQPHTTHDVCYFVTEANWDQDVYLDSAFRSFNLFIMSETPLDQCDIQIDIPIETPYTFDVYESPRGKAPSVLADNPGEDVKFTYDIYLHYCEFDWTLLAEEYSAMTAAKEAYAQEKNDTNKIALRLATEAYEQHYREKWDDYLLLDESALPEFYYYDILITFDFPNSNESITEITVSVDNVHTVCDVGEVRLYPSNFIQNPTDLSGILAETNYASSSIAPYLSESFDKGLGTFKAEQDMLLTGFGFVEGEIGISNLRVSIDQAGDFMWDGKMPITIKKGSTVQFYATVSDPRMTLPGYHISDFIRIEVEVDGNVYEHLSQYKFSHFINPFELYASSFDGIDFTEYYETYYFPFVVGKTS